MNIKRVLASAPRDHDPGAACPLLTRWGEALDPETVRGEALAVETWIALANACARE